MTLNKMYPNGLVLAVANDDGIGIVIPRVIVERLNNLIGTLKAGQEDAKGQISMSYTELFNYLLNAEEAYRALQDG